MEKEKLEKLVEEYANKMIALQPEYSRICHDYLAGYNAAYEKLRGHIYFLETQLREAHSRILRLEAEKQ